MLLQDMRARRIVDAFRAIGILLVILFHVVIGLVRVMPDDTRAGLAADISGFMSIAWQALGSEVIFLFSGFLVSYLLIAEWKAEGQIDLGRYIWRRAARIVPLYYVALVLYALATQPDLPNILASGIFLGFILRGENVIPVGWSMEAMVQVYLLLPFIVAFVMRGHAVLKLTALILGSVAIRWIFVLQSDDVFADLFLDAIATTKFSDAARELYFMAWFRATPFLMGVALAWAAIERGEALAAAFARPAIWLAALGVGILAMAGSGWLPVQDGASWLYARAGEHFWHLFWSFQRFIFASGATLVALVLFYAPPFRAPWLLKALDLGPWRVIATNIYGIYLFHFVFILLAAVIVFRSTDEDALLGATVWHVLGVWVVAAALSTGAAILLRKWVEDPARKWILSRVLKDKKPNRGGIRTPGEAPK